MSDECKPTVDDDDSVTMVEILDQESRLQEDASAVLGGSDPHQCTYPEGYVKRQAVYACVTCKTTGPAGFCLACSYCCHEGHELYELYTKRHFRCDCGNSKFGQSKCKLVPTKDSENEENQYSQNFSGTYCTCVRPYPDPEDEIEDVMIQCVVCEDWYHGRHLGTDMPDADNYAEMICTGCMARHPFLWTYQVSSPVKVLNESTEEEEVDVEGEDGVTKPENGEPMKQQSPLESNNQEPIKEKSDQQKEDEIKIDNTEPVKEEQPASESESQEPIKQESDKQESLQKSSSATSMKRGFDSISSSKDCPETSDSSTSESPETKPSAKRAKVEKEGTVSDKHESQKTCLFQDLQKGNYTVKDCSTFWPSGWRERLCSCTLCLSMYEKEGVAFLLDLSDTVSAYEEKGQGESSTSEVEKVQRALSQIGRVRMIEVIHGYKDMSEKLLAHLKTYADAGKVVKKEDITSFFNEMTENRKKKTTPSIPHFCK